MIDTELQIKRVKRIGCHNTATSSYSCLKPKSKDSKLTLTNLQDDLEISLSFPSLFQFLNVNVGSAACGPKEHFHSICLLWWDLDLLPSYELSISLEGARSRLTFYLNTRFNSWVFLWSDHRRSVLNWIGRVLHWQGFIHC